MVVAIAFGLAMDYELFLISRIKEEYGATGDNAGSVAVGLQRSGRVVSAAALLFVLVMLAFSASALSIVKLVGVGLALAVLLDVDPRAVLVPAIMKMAGMATVGSRLAGPPAPPPRSRRVRARRPARASGGRPGPATPGHRPRLPDPRPDHPNRRRGTRRRPAAPPRSRGPVGTSRPVGTELLVRRQHSGQSQPLRHPGHLPDHPAECDRGGQTGEVLGSDDPVGDRGVEEVVTVHCVAS